MVDRLAEMTNHQMYGYNRRDASFSSLGQQISGQLLDINDPRGHDGCQNPSKFGDWASADLALHA